MDMKGQYLSIEYVMFFAIGIAMVIAVYFIFINISTSLREPAIKYQLEKTGQLISGTIVNVFEASNSTDSLILYNLSIPTSLSGCIYSIEIKEKMLLNCSDTPSLGTSFVLYGINIKSENIIYSSKGFLELKAEKGVVELK